MIWSAISGISSSKRRRTKSGWVRLRMILTRWPALRTSRIDGPDPLVGVVALAGDLLAARQQGVGLAQVDDGGAPLEPLDGAGDQVALLVLELVEEAVALGLADLLDDHLLGGLGGDPAERLGVEFVVAVSGDDVAGGPVDADEHAFLDLEVAFGGQLMAASMPSKDDLARRSSSPRASCPRVRGWPCRGLSS